MFNLFKDFNGSISSRIISMFLVIIFDLLAVFLSLVLQIDIPQNASHLILTLTTTVVPVALCTQVYQNIKQKELELGVDIDGDGKIG